MNYRGIFFDFDYTLGDATDSIVAGFQNAFFKMGRPVPDRDAIRATVGYLLEDAYTLLSGDASPEGRAQFRPYYQEAALPSQLEGIALFPGTVELLQGLHRAGVKLAIVSSRRSLTIERTLEGAGLSEAVEFVIGSTDVTRHKPDPEGLLLAMDRLGLKPDEVLYCGDTVMDAGAAQNAGCHFCAVLNGTTKEEAFAPFPKVHVAPDLFDLAAWLGL